MGSLPSYNYADRPLGKYSMYWFARLLRCPGAPLRRPNRADCWVGCGLGHLLGLLRMISLRGCGHRQYSIGKSGTTPARQAW